VTSEPSGGAAATRHLRKLWKELAAVGGFDEGASIFSESDDDRAYFVNGTQVAHVDGASVWLRLTRPVIREHRESLKANAHIDLRRSGSDWITIDVVGVAERDLALRLAVLASQAHIPGAGAPRKPPPEGTELERRRRFH